MRPEEFGAELLRTDDLDPIYVALRKVKWPPNQIHRWLLAYWCFYSAGLACYASESVAFWTTMMDAAKNESASPLGGRWPRGAERRHFRGAAAVDAVADLMAVYGRSPEDFVTDIVSRAPDFARIRAHVQAHQGFGPWISFKIADMLERCLDVPVCFDRAAVFMYRDPVKAAQMFYNCCHQKPIEDEYPKERIMADIVPWTVERLTREFASFTAPPIHDRPVGLQEIETILCKWKSHVHGHYPIGKDTHEIRLSLMAWSETSRAARDFLGVMP